MKGVTVLEKTWGRGGLLYDRKLRQNNFNKSSLFCSPDRVLLADTASTLLKMNNFMQILS